MYKLLMLILLVGTSACVTFPNFPTFYSHQDLLEQERELDKSFKKRID